MKKAIYGVILAAAIGVFLFSGWKLYSIYSEYRAGSDEYQMVAKNVTLVTAPAPKKDNMEKTPEQKPEQEQQTFLSIDFDTLERSNPDFIGWVYVEGLGISYPIVQGQDNENYLHRTFEGQYNGSGCIFADYRLNSDFTDYNTFLYGHNMKNGTMFGSLKKLRQDDSIYDKNPYFYVYTKDYIYEYKICSYYITAPDSDSFNLVQTKEDYDNYQKKVLGRSLRDLGVDELETSANMVTLSTCSGSGETKQRFLVHGLQTDRFENIYH